MTDLTGPLPEPTPARRADPDPVVEPDPLLYATTRQTAAALGITPNALRVRQHRGTAPPSIRIDGRRYYPRTTIPTGDHDG